MLSEFYWTVTRRLAPPLPDDEAQEVVRQLAESEVVPIDAGLVDAAVTLSRRHRIALWDAQIIAAAKRSGCTEILTEDLNDGATLEGVKVRNPFAAPER